MSAVRTIAALIPAAIALAACNDQHEPMEPVETSDMGMDGMSAPADGALGLTMAQLREAEIVDSAGKEIAEVENVTTNPDGTVAMLVVEIEDSDPDRYVSLPLDGLVAVRQGDDYNLRTEKTAADLAKLPEATFSRPTLTPMAGGSMGRTPAGGTMPSETPMAETEGTSGPGMTPAPAE